MFRLAQNKTTITREVLAGVTSFAAMAYILVVNPDMLSTTGMDRTILIASTALAAAAGTLLMALLTNYPIALAPGMGLNAFFTFTVCGQLEVPWQGALAMVFWTGVLFLILSVTPLREQIVEAIPEPLKTGIQCGIGLFIVVVGFKALGFFGDPAPGFFALRTASPTGVTWITTGVAALGCLIAIFLMRREVPGALLIAMAAITLIGLVIPLEGKPMTARPDSLFSIPPSIAPVFSQIDWLFPFRNLETVWLAMITLFFVDLFDSVGTLIGVTRRARLVDENGVLPRMNQALAADAGATALGACFGTSTTTAYIESATGVEAGGRTGLTGVVVAACFSLALLIHPLISAIPTAAAVPALIIVGLLMAKGISQLGEATWQARLSAIAMALLIPLKFQIAEGIAVGCIIYTLLMLCSGKGREVHWIMIALSALFLIKFIFDH
ncbi:MAG: NCS2 family permease [Verrucomicrobiota bacterium]